MKPFLTLARTRTHSGAELTLHQHDTHFQMRLNGQALMGTHAPESERTLADLACRKLKPNTASQVLIGGLGFGFSLQRVLELAGPTTRIQVAEWLPVVVDWNRQFLASVNGRLLDDPRVLITISDVVDLLVDAPAGHYDAVLLDIDNGPVAMVEPSNARLYEPAGLAALRRSLKPHGRATIWSATPDPAFARKLARAGFRVEVVAARSSQHPRSQVHTLFVAEPTTA